MAEAEQIIIQLPMPMSVAGRLLRAIGEEWPASKVRTDHGLGTDKLVIEVDPDDGDQSEF